MTRATLLGSLLLALCCGTAQAQHLSASVRALVLRPRPHAPQPVEITLTWRGPGLLEGRLELRVSAFNELLLHYRSSEIAQPPGQQTTRWLLPPRKPGNEGQQFVKLRFLGQGQSIDLGRFPISAPRRQTGRTFVIAAARSAARRPRGRDALLPNLQIERFFPKQAKRPESAYDGKTRLEPFNSYVRLLEQDAFPTSPLHYCSYDLVLLQGKSFAALGRKQRAALGAWIRAGGSACIVPTGRLEQPHVRWLNELTGGARFSLDFEGRLEPAGIQRHRVELGRLVLVAGVDADDRWDSSEWMQSVAFLWKVRTRIQRRLNRPGGTFPQDRLVYEEDYQYYTGSWDSLFSNVQSALAPEGVQPVPIWMIMLLLICFVAAIGPLDYLILGRLNRRKWTWLTFPLCSIGFALLMVGMSEAYLGHNDHLRALVVTDIGKGGVVLRQNRIEMLMLARPASRVYRGKAQIISALDTDEEQRSLPVYQGRLPVSYNMTRQIGQWSPQITRYFSIGGDKPALRLNWDRVTVAMLEDRKRWPELARTLTGGSQFDGRIVLHHLDNSYPLTRGVGHPISDELARMLAVCEVDEYRVLSQLSPHGGPNLEDLATLDPSDARQWLIVAMVREGDDLLLYQRLYNGDRK